MLFVLTKVPFLFRWLVSCTGIEHLLPALLLKLLLLFPGHQLIPDLCPLHLTGGKVLKLTLNLCLAALHLLHLLSVKDSFTCIDVAVQLGKLLL